MKNQSLDISPEKARIWLSAIRDLKDWYLGKLPSHVISPCFPMLNELEAWLEKRTKKE